MSEGLFGEALAEDAAGADIGVELALERSRTGARRGRGDDVADALLRRQTQKLEAELEHMKLRALNEKLAIALKGLGVGAAAIVAIGLAALVWDAAHDRSQVVEPFRTPPALAQQGFDGSVVASRLLDHLNAMQNDRGSYLSLRAVSLFSIEPTHEVKLQIPEAGVSISELRQALVEWLGHQTHTSGSVVRQGDQLFVTTRVGAYSQTVSGPADDVDTLIGKAAETVFNATDPGAYADYLRGHGRVAEAIPIYRALTVKGSRRDRAWAYLGWSDALRVAPIDPSPEKNVQIALGLLREAARLDPNLWLVWENIGDAQQFALQDTEGALQSRRRTLRAKDFGGANAARARYFTRADQIYLDEFLGDYSDALKIAIEEADTQTDAGSAYDAADLAAYEAVYSHDNGLSLAWTQRSLDRSDGADPVRRDQRINRLRYWRLMNVDDWSPAADSIALSMGSGPTTPTNVYWRALEEIALARAGRLAEARTIDTALPRNCYICEVASGVLANAAGDVTGSERTFAEAIRFGRSLPKAPTFAGEARLGRGDVEGAIAMFSLANARGPHNADALELWGEALMRKADYAGAAAKFEAADKYAPHWGRNHLRWGQALAHLGKSDAAKAQFRAAAPLALSPADRAQLAKA